MLVDYTNVRHIYLVCGYTDMRKSIDGLAALITDQYNLNLFDDCAFLFCGRRRDRYKVLYWDGDGFLLLYKRLEIGRIQWPRTYQEAKKISHQQLRWLLECLAIEQPRAIGEAPVGSVT